LRNSENIKEEEFKSKMMKQKKGGKRVTSVVSETDYKPVYHTGIQNDELSEVMLE